MKAIKSTYIPENRPDINTWFKYIHKVNSPAVNTIRKGGLWYADQQEQTLNQFKKIINENTK
jgi:hypothetical protein